MPSSSKARKIKPAEERQGELARPSTSGTRKRRSTARISVACEACKKRKTKCTGGPPPCQLCELLGTDCMIDLALDLRRRAAFQRSEARSKSYQNTLNRLIECIRDGSSPQFQSLLGQIRCGASNQDVIDAVQTLPTALDDDRENTSPLQSHSKESPPSPDVPIDQEPLLQTEHSAYLNSGESSLPSSLRKEKQPARDIASLLSKLKLLPTADGERLLGQILADYSRGKQYEVRYSAAQHSHDGFGRNAAVALNVERSKWHPALRLRLQPTESEEERQVCSSSNNRTPPVPTGAEDVFVNCVNIIDTLRASLCAICRC